jgi:hypothetical protein
MNTEDANADARDNNATTNFNIARNIVGRSALVGITEQQGPAYPFPHHNKRCTTVHSSNAAQLYHIAYSGYWREVDQTTRFSPFHRC